MLHEEGVVPVRTKKSLYPAGHRQGCRALRKDGTEAVHAVPEGHKQADLGHVVWNQLPPVSKSRIHTSHEQDVVHP